MTPRVRTHAASTPTTARSRCIELTRATGHSRFPVLDAEENVVGTVHVKHAVALPVHERSTTKVKHLMARPIIVPDSLRLDPLLALLREDGFQMAVVMDEYGGFAGIVTLEDVVEEIVGDISDEHDRLSANARRRRDGTWSLSGLLRPDEVEDLTGDRAARPRGLRHRSPAWCCRCSAGCPSVGDLAEIRVPDRSDPDEPREQLAVLTRRPHGRPARSTG